jgi:hypothetical protein
LLTDWANWGSLGGSRVPSLLLVAVPVALVIYCMSRRELVERLEEAASKIDELPRPALQALLRDAAQRLRNIEAATVDREVGVAIDRLAADHGLPRSLVLSTIVRDWLVMTGRVRNVTLDEDADTEGTA